MSKTPPVHELRFLKLTNNHNEFVHALSELGCPAPDITQYARHVCGAWFSLGEAHLAEARAMQKSKCLRAIYSRSYYAAYNASKAMRYMVAGFVSMKGDDHAKASVDLPGDFPEVAKWATRLSVLYEHRLHADYDNWSDTAGSFTLAPEAAVAEADEFINNVRNYLNKRFGMKL